MTTPELTMLTVPLTSLHPNPWNPNRMTPAIYEAERESIRSYGFIDPITCRPHPDLPDEWQVLDGEHRLNAARDEGLEEVPITPLYGLSEAQARKLTVILNETRGEADVGLLGRLLLEVKRELPDSEYALGLPYNEEELRRFTEIGAVDWDSYQPPERAEAREHTITLTFDRDGYQRFLALAAILARSPGWTREGGISQIVLRAVVEAAA